MRTESLLLLVVVVAGLCIGLIGWRALESGTDFGRVVGEAGKLGPSGFAQDSERSLADATDDQADEHSGFVENKLFTHIITPNMTWISPPEELALKFGKDSPDGAYTAYLAKRLGGSGSDHLVIQDHATGEWRTVEPKVHAEGFHGRFHGLETTSFSWHPDGRLITTEEYTRKPLVEAIRDNDALAEEYEDSHVYSFRVHNPADGSDIFLKEVKAELLIYSIGTDSKGDIFLARRDEGTAPNNNTLVFEQFDPHGSPQRQRTITVPKGLQELTAFPDREQVWFSHVTSEEDPRKSLGRSIGFIDLTDPGHKIEIIRENSVLLAMDDDGEQIMFYHCPPGEERAIGYYNLRTKTEKILGPESNFPWPVSFSHDGSAVYLRGLRDGVHYGGLFLTDDVRGLYRMTL